jgi:hypothetical protein
MFPQYVKQNAKNALKISNPNIPNLRNTHKPKPREKEDTGPRHKHKAT